MPRFCVICGKVQSHSFSVFSFPTSQTKRNAWLDVILRVKPDFLKDKGVVDSKQLKNGVCELHFFQSEISNGKKRRLSKDAVPTLDISVSGKCFSTLRKFKTFKINETEDSPLISAKPQNSDNGTIRSEISLVESKHKISNESYLPDCTIEIEDKTSSPKIYESRIENIFHEKNRKEVCFCCACENNTKTLFSILKAKSSEGDLSLVEELSSIFSISQEKLISLSCFICLKCLKVIEDILNLKYMLSSLIAYIKNRFCENNYNNNNNNCEKESSWNVEESNRIEKELLSCNKKGDRRSIRIQPSLKKFSCPECLKKFTSLSSFYIHMAMHDEDIRSPKTAKSRVVLTHCKYCNISFSSKSLYSLHLKSHTGTLDCRYCGRLITSKSRLNAHIKKFHGIGEEKERSFQCKSCVKTFSSRGGLKYHELTWHKKGKSFTCEICFKVFSYPMLYKNHKLFVHGDKNLLCEICGEMFFTKAKLNVHVNAVHIKALTWSCNICNEKFTTSALYKHHISVKHKRVIYSCSHCSAQFKKKSTLIQHMWKHGIYFCQKCNLKYTGTLPFVSHMLESHNLDVSKMFSYKSQSPVNSSEDISETINKDCDTSKKDDDSSVVISDILMSSNEFENSTLQTLSFPASNRGREDSSKYDELSSVEPTIPFDNVEALEIQTVPNDPMELEDVSLINVQMLQEIENRHMDLKSIKEPMSSEKEESLSISHELQSNIMTGNSINNSSEISRPTSITPNNPDDSSLDRVEMIKNISPQLEDSTKTFNSPTLRLAKSRVHQSDLPHLPVIIQPVKNDKWPFSNALVTRASTSVDSVIHSITMDKVPPITREIDITIPPEDEVTKVPIPSQINSNNNGKLHEQNLSSLSVDIGGKVDVRYVMYFKTQTGKE